VAKLWQGVDGNRLDHACLRRRAFEPALQAIFVQMMAALDSSSLTSTAKSLGYSR
jgi:hypothetical protein